MNNVLRVALVDPTDSTREMLKSTLLGMEVIWLEAECSRYEFFADVVGQTNPDIGVVSLDGNPEKALALIEELHDVNPECSILVVSASTDGNMILRSMRAGAKEFLTHPVVLEDLVAALERISNQKFGKGESRSRGCRVITVGGATGGVGATSLAVNLGCILASNEKNNVVLIDLDLALGDADVFLDTIPDYTLVDVAQNIQRLDFNLLKRSLTKHSSGLYLLPRPVQLHDDSLISPADFSRVIGLLKATFTHLIIDLSKGFRPLDFVAMREAHDNLMVIQLDLPCLRNVVRLMMSFAETDGLKEKTRIVVNRVGLDSGQISLKKAQETIGSEIYWQIPNDYRVMVEVRNNGVPLIEQAPRAGITQAISSLADALSGDSKKAAAAGKAGISRWFGFLGGSKQAGEKQASAEEGEETVSK
ncbi:nucleotide-binding protein [Blastopirellula retiformator]|uniref:Septum site-determining protein MinD n=1 Tax=Blastopirellula retiformator TaxID=2527970 RepID=A0A5C5UWW8_9BACT|nr:response regulator [Blastopirellula retiformator]TWT30876.1 Septum site-determining protein MinD [Blastopirellula retiformator]